MELTECTLKGNVLAGIDVIGADSLVTAAKCHDISGNGKNGAVVVAGGRLNLQDCYLDSNWENGISVCDGGSSVEADCHCRFSGNDGAGVSCWNGGVMNLMSCSMQSNRVGLRVTGAGSRVIATGHELGTAIRNNKECGVVVDAGGSLVLHLGMVVSNANHGIDVFGPGSNVKATKCLASLNRGSGAVCKDGGVMDLVECTVVENMFGGVSVHGAKRQQLVVLTLVATQRMV
jgi:Right handed beta helix region